MKKFLREHLPVGANIRREAWGCIAGLAGSVLLSFGFFARLHMVSAELKESLRVFGGHIPKDMVSVPDYPAMAGDFFWGFAALIFGMAALIVYHYSIHWNTSKSVYLMRRLPDRGQLRRRCLTLPLLVILAAVILAVILYCVYYNAYRAAIPPEYAGGFGLPF